MVGQAPAQHPDPTPLPIALVGFMGSGKSSVGRRLAAALGRSFADTDTVVVEQLGTSIPALFRAGEEREFRTAESAVIAEMVRRRPPLVLALGGGAFEDAETRRLLLAEALVIYLDVDWERLRTALRGLRVERPLLEGRSDEEIHGLFVRRSENYAKAHLHVPIPYGGVDDGVQRVLTAVEGHQAARS